LGGSVFLVKILHFLYPKTLKKISLFRNLKISFEHLSLVQFQIN
jgi:hypothetical protein